MNSNSKKKSDNFANKEKISVREGDSSVSEFIRKPLPSDEEVRKFEEKLFRKSREEKEEAVKSSLSEIYKDDQGNMVNVKKIEKKKKRGLLSCFFYLLFIAFILAAGFVVYYVYYHGGSSIEVDFSIKGEEEIVANKEFSYVIEYKNLSTADLNNVQVEVQYPDNFIFLDSEPGVSRKDTQRDYWNIDRIASGERGEIEIKGKMIGTKGQSGVISSKINYTPSNFSSEFGREDSLNTRISDIGLDIDISSDSSILVGEEKEANISIKPQPENYLNKFVLELDIPENMNISELEAEDEDINISEGDRNSWLISEVKDSLINLKLNYSFSEKDLDEESINFLFKGQENDQGFKFFEKTLDIEVIKSNMDLSLTINDSDRDEAVNFGEKLDYSIDYKNKGDDAMENVMIMAVLDSDILNWTSLESEYNPSEEGNTLIWTQEEIPGLEELERGEGGSINFSIEVIPFPGTEDDRDYKIRSYAQFVASGDRPSFDVSSDDDMDNRSNTIENRVNSNLRLSEEIRYFSEDNDPVGSGPLPPKVGEETSFRVYWTIRNDLHELRDLKVSLELPDNISWDEQEVTSAGNISYDQEKGEVIWTLGRLPLSVHRADAEFNISLEPEEDDEGKVLILSPGASVEAYDTETESTINIKGESKTTALEDDEVANRTSDGRVED